MIRINQIKISVDKNDDEHLIHEISKKLHIHPRDIKNFKIIKQSLDARDKNNVLYVYTIDVEIINENKCLTIINDKNITKSPKETYIKQIPQNTNITPVIVGSGPAGLFAAYTFIESGIKPIIIERGEKIEERIKSVEQFWESNSLNPNSNVQFGEGGAGTFSDGKLNTLVKDKLFYGRHVLETFIKFGAPKEILYSYKPHIGTNILRTVIVNMREYLISKGTTFKYNSCVTDIITDNEKLQGIIINNQEKLSCNTLVLAIGHSARDTFRMLHQRGLSMSPKPFAVGIRIEHPQDMINESQYGKNLCHI